MHWWYGGWGWLAWLTMSVVMVGFWALVAWAFVSWWRTDQRDQPASGATPEEALAERFAAGDIDADEYRSRLDTLHQTKVDVR